MIYLCCDKHRRLLLREENDRRKANALPTLNGIDFLEVLDREAPAGAGGIQRQNTLLVRSFESWPAFDKKNIRITGGERISPVRVIWAFPANAIPAASVPSAAERNFFAGLPQPDHLLVVRTDSTGDYSRYRLALATDEKNEAPPAGFDPLFGEVDFSFKVECPSDFDCAPRHACPPVVRTPPAIDYLAKDYASFRRLMLDRISLLSPRWRERNAADLGVALVELLAYAGDRLSYRQDAAATEAYLDSARRRVSVRRHARLVDYFMHDGCNARVWARVACDPAAVDVKLDKETRILSKVLPRSPRLFPNSGPLEEAMRQRPVVFETLREIMLQGAHESMPFYTWGDERCCLPKGATRATLRGHFPKLAAGDVLIFAEVLSPRTGDPADADRTRRHAVRLTRAAPFTDPLNGVQVTEIAWGAADALPFSFCISAITDAEHGERPVDRVSEAWGNIVLADHGATTRDEELGEVPPPRLFLHSEEADRCERAAPLPIPPRFNPRLKHLPVTQACAYDDKAPAALAMAFSPADALPEIKVESVSPPGQPVVWERRQDLLGSDDGATEFVAEVELDGVTRLRFGDDTHGRRPKPGTSFIARSYRVGNGVAGNVGAGALFHIVANQPDILGVSNPMPAQGGTEPETMEEVRHRAPFAFRRQERAVTEADYAAATERDPGVQRAAATFRWTGSWHTVFVAADPKGGTPPDRKARSEFARGLLSALERYRMAGHDLETDAPRYVSLEIEMHVCVKQGYFRSDVRAALLGIFNNRVLPDGRPGVFHPDNFTFGQPVHLSPLYARAQAVPGVASAHVETFQRQGLPSAQGLQDGRLDFDRLEIARCDNDPNFPERGIFRINLGGGK